MNNGDQQNYLGVDASSSGNEVKKPRLWIGSFLLCFIAALAIWIYVMNITTQNYEKTFSLIDIKIEGVDQLAERSNLSVINLEESKVSVTVSGLRSDVTKLTADDFSAYIDVGSITESGRHGIDVSINLPSSVSLVSRTPETVNVSVDERIESTIDVVVELTSYSMEMTYELGQPICDIKTVNVSGPAGTLSRIKCAMAYIDLGTVTTGVEMRSELVLIDAQDKVIDTTYISMDHSSVTVTVSVTAQKLIDLVVNFTIGAHESQFDSITLSHNAAIIKGDPKALEAIQSVSVYSVYKNDEGEFICPVANITLPTGIEFVDPPENIIVTIVPLTPDTSSTETTFTPESTQDPNEITSPGDGIEGPGDINAGNNDAGL